MWHGSHRSERVMTGLFILSMVGYIYCAWFQYIHWQHLFSAISILSVMSILRAQQPPRMLEPERILNYVMISELRLLDEEEFRSVLSHYRYITPRLLHELRLAIHHRNPQEISLLAARLRSSSTQLGAERLAALAQSIEYCAGCQDWRNAPIIFTEVCAAYPEVDAALLTLGARR